MNSLVNRLEKIEEIILLKRRKVLILDYVTSEPESWIEVNKEKYEILPNEDIEAFIHEKIMLIRGIHVCALYLSKLAYPGLLQMQE